RALIPQQEGTQMEDVLGVKCNFETDCAWTWDENVLDGFTVVTGANLTDSNRTGIMPGPGADPNNDANGHFLHLRLEPSTKHRTFRSPTFSVTRENCFLEMFIHQSSMQNGSLKIVIEPQSSSSWVPAEIAGNDLRQWQQMHFRIGRVSQDFQIVFEVMPRGLVGSQRGHVSIDNLSLKGCFPEGPRTDTCSNALVKCQKNKRDQCLKTVAVCDIDVDCDDKEDELLNCEKIPLGGKCDFESGWCGWQNSGKAIMLWERHHGPTPTEKTGPETDHTFQNSNNSGHYLYVNMNQHRLKQDGTPADKTVGFASNAVMNSVVFNPPPQVHYNASSPYGNSCMVRFYVHQFGPNAGSINLSVVEIKEKENITTTLWWSSKNRGNDWNRENLIMPNITSKYFLQFEARMGMRIYSDVAIDDFSLSPECFGLNIPIDQLDGYNYWDPRLPTNKQTHRDFVNKSFIELTSCGARGRDGPRNDDCSEAYKEKELQQSIKVLEDSPFKGVQVWKVPSEDYYTVIAKGAGGGLGSGGVGSSRGALAVSVLELHKDEEIYFLVGQKGEHACIKSMGYRDKECEPRDNDSSDQQRNSKTKQVKNMVIEDGAGGGGGATYVFVLNSMKEVIPLVVAAGGGGLGIGRYFDDHDQHGRIVDANGIDVSGEMIGEINKTGGPGGGWRASDDYVLNVNTGASLLEGSRGGIPCYPARGIHGQGGFGGGGGGCNTGGGGGGYAGGDTRATKSNGEGGTSYVWMKRSVPELTSVVAGDNSGNGMVIIIRAINSPGCGCDYRCVVLDEFGADVACICPEGSRLKKDNLTACEIISPFEEYPMNYLMIIFAVVSVLLFVALSWLIFILYNRYQRKREAVKRHKRLLEQDLQLSRLRHTADESALTNFNPNYGCDGILNGNVDVKSLPQVARESLRLVKALGQGAFGEVYQGLYRHRDGDAVEMPVAVKTLPEMSTGQAEADFLMEAAIMAKFNHPNIVHLIGVCFDRHPRFIVLELLAGGDLKNFLREGRSKPGRPSPLTMKDLVFCAVDVAKGCRYMESKRFIHRDIAARNCLLSSKGPGRVVKIADFGMARDIYRSDYYRKGGKAMLPIKWMPPEAFLDGIFTSKTDVWSFGVLLWEVFSLGLMPYTGLPNRDVMQLVTGGGRLDASPGCPNAIYRIMADCWGPSPESRPTFSNLLERLSACTQDPEVMNAPLPSFFRPPSTERDQTIMRPPNDDYCLTAPNSSDYLIPLPGPRTAAERLLSEATGVTLSESVTTYSAPTVTSPSVPKPMQDSGCWETSFIMPNSKSDQHLLSPDNSHTSSDDKLISLDTPQQTPTTIKPPHSFSDKDPITLDPASLPKQGMSYANVRMANSAAKQNDDKIMANGSVPADNLNKAPFTIQGFNDRYIKNENHSEISC
ncbi:hypothetical protein HA402_009365, partial [Bradysia odoriphaga]